MTLRVALCAEDQAADALGDRARLLLRRAKPDRDGEKTIILDFEKEEYAVSSLAARGRVVRIVRPASLKRSLVRLAHDLQARYRANPRARRQLRPATS